MISTTLHHALILFILFLLTKDNKANAIQNTYTSTKTLQTNELAFAQKKPYSCTLCNNSFTGKRSLTRHISIHTRGKTLKANETNITPTSSLTTAFEPRMTIDYFLLEPLFPLNDYDNNPKYSFMQIDQKQLGS